MLPRIFRYEGPTSIKEIFVALICVLIIPFIPVILTLAGIYWIIRTTWLILLVRLTWYPQQKYMLFVYSNSPNWKEYLESNILPRISTHAVVINWSDRSNWDWSGIPLELKVFKHWSGVSRYFLEGKWKWDGEAYNPIAITFLPWWRPRVFRFWQAFKDFKHGKDRNLKKLEAKLFHVLKPIV